MFRGFLEVDLAEQYLLTINPLTISNNPIKDLVHIDMLLKGQQYLSSIHSGFSWVNKMNSNFWIEHEK